MKKFWLVKGRGCKYSIFFYCPQRPKLSVLKIIFMGFVNEKKNVENFKYCRFKYLQLNSPLLFFSVFLGFNFPVHIPDMFQQNISVCFYVFMLHHQFSALSLSSVVITLICFWFPSWVTTSCFQFNITGLFLCNGCYNRPLSRQPLSSHLCSFSTVKAWMIEPPCVNICFLNSLTKHFIQEIKRKDISNPTKTNLETAN